MKTSDFNNKYFAVFCMLHTRRVGVRVAVRRRIRCERTISIELSFQSFVYSQCLAYSSRVVYAQRKWPYRYFAALFLFFLLGITACCVHALLCTCDAAITCTRVLFLCRKYIFSVRNGDAQSGRLDFPCSGSTETAVKHW